MPVARNRVTIWIQRRSSEVSRRCPDAALTATAPGFAALYGISANTRAWWDLEPGRALGYEPQDDAEEFAASITARATDESDAAHVGGPMATHEFYRPALDRA